MDEDLEGEVERLRSDVAEWMAGHDEQRQAKRAALDQVDDLREENARLRASLAEAEAELARLRLP